jgi:hypothetical protein
MGRYFNSPSSPYLGSGTYLGGGIADRNVNLGYGLPSMEPNPEFKTNPYGLEDDQALEKWGKSKRIVGKDASEGLKRNLQGLADFATLGIWDFDNRGNLGGGQHLPGLAGGSGYGGQAQLGSVPQTIPVMTPPTMGPPMGGSPVPSNLNMGTHLLENTGIGLGNQFLSQWQTNRALDSYYNRALQTRQAADAQDVLLSQAMQRTDKGQSERATEQQSRMLGAAQANYLRRLGIKGMSDSAATKAVGGLTRSQFGSSSPVSSLGNYKAG